MTVLRNSNSIAACLVALLILTAQNHGFAQTNYTLDGCSVSAGQSTTLVNHGSYNSPFFDGETVETGLTLSASSPDDAEVEGTLSDPSVSWTVTSVQCKSTQGGSWTGANSPADYNFGGNDGNAPQDGNGTQASPGSLGFDTNNSTGMTTNLWGTFNSANYFQITVQATISYSDTVGDTWTGTGTGTFNLVAGQWIPVSPDLQNPNPATSQQSFAGDAPPSNYAETDINCGASWCKAYTTTSTEFALASPVGGDSCQSGQASWTHELTWIPVGSDAVKTNFTWSTWSETDSQWYMDLFQGHAFEYDNGTVEGRGVVSATASPSGGGAQTNDTHFNVYGTQTANWLYPDQWTPTLSYPTGISVSPPSDSSNEYSSNNGTMITAPLKLGGSVTASSPVSVEADSYGSSSINWGSSLGTGGDLADGPFMALGQAQIDGPPGGGGPTINISLVTPNPRAK